VLEEAHVLEAEQGNLVLGLMHDSRQNRVFALEPLLDAVPTRRPRLLALSISNIPCQPAPLAHFTHL
jgi:hypothetical protein